MLKLHPNAVFQSFLCLTLGPLSQIASLTLHQSIWCRWGPVLLGHWCDFTCYTRLHGEAHGYYRSNESSACGSI